MNALRTVHKSLINLQKSGDNLGLRLDKLNSSIDDPNDYEARNDMLQIMSAFSMTDKLMESYAYAFNQWKTILKNQNNSDYFDIRSNSKILIGTGNASVHEFGVNLNKPWGVPYISGATLKGLVSSYLFKNGGDQWWKSNKGSTKSDFQVELFGGTRKDKSDVNSYCGSIIFNDAWIYPVKNQKWFVNDIINVHYQEYYSGKRLPDGTENPIPVKIAALRPNLKFFVTIQGEEKERTFIKSILAKALVENGIGGKTSVGYGRFEVLKSKEEKFTEYSRLIADANDDELRKLFDCNDVDKKSLHNAFSEAISKKPLSQKLFPVFLKYNPLRIILHEKDNIKNYKDLKDFYKKNIGNDKFKDYIENNTQCKLSKTEDAQKLFDFIYDLPGCPCDDDIINTDNVLLKNLVYKWDDLTINDDNIDEIIKSRDRRKWLLDEDLKKVIETKANLSDDAKELALLEF